MNKIRFIINSDLNNVALVGMSINKICSLTPFSEKQAFQIELCAVEAINNSIIHAYNNVPVNEVEIALSINDNVLQIEVFDRGKAMKIESLEKADIKVVSNYANNSEIFLESGRGLGFIKEYMDKVSYKSDKSGNCLTMIKYFQI